jgi:hypothetical protein
MIVNLHKYYKKHHSQYGQDGIIEKIFDLIGTTNKCFVEFGSSGTDVDGNTSYFRQFGFNGLLMDGSDTPYGKPVDKKYDVKIEMVKASNINSLFEKYNVPNEFDLLSIDIDGQDFYVWNAINSKYQPRVVCVEVNYFIKAGLDAVMPFDEDNVWDGGYKHGASITAMKKLGNSKGYDLVYFCGSDAIFIRQDLIINKDFYIAFKNDEYILEYINFENMRCKYTDRFAELFDLSSWWCSSGL